MMFGPKKPASSKPSSPGGSLRSSRSSSLNGGSCKPPTKSSVSPSTAGSASRTAAKSVVTSSPLAKKKALSPPIAAISKQSTASLVPNSLANGRSSSKSSVISDTSASICSSSSHLKQPQQRTRATSTSSSSSIRQPLVSGSRSVSKTTIGAKSQGSTVSRPRSTSIVSVGSAGLSSSSRRVPSLAMSLQDKDQQIKLLIKERDEQKYQAQMMARKAEEWEEKFVQSEVERSHVTIEADDEVIELRRLAQELEDENKRLTGRLVERDQQVGDTQFKIDELEIERQELRRELDDKQSLIESLERQQPGMGQGGPENQIDATSKAKHEREIQELNEKLLHKDEQMMQLRSSLEMRKNELNNLQTRAADLEKKLKIETERSDRHLKRIDEINLELKAAEAKLSTKCEENEMYEKQLKQLRQELRSAEDKLEQISLARKKDVDILHNKLSAARRGSTTPTSPVPYKTPTPQDEIVRLQMEIRDLKDQLIDREAELDCNRRDMDVLRRKMETRTLEVDCNNQELARRCQDLLEQNRQSEDTVKQLLKSTTEHSAQLIRATDDLKEANGKCIKLRDEINELEGKLEEQMKKSSALVKENSRLKDENEDQSEQVEMLRQQVDSLNEQLRDLCQQLDHQTNCLHKDREALANQLADQEIEATKMTHDLATAKQDLRTSKLQTQEVASERDRIKQDLVMKEQYIASRNDIIETLRHELEDCKKSLAEHKQRIEEMREAAPAEALEAADKLVKEMGTQLEGLRSELQLKLDESSALKARCDQLSADLEANQKASEQQELEKLESLKRDHDAELAKLKETIEKLEAQVDELEHKARASDQTDDGPNVNKKTRQQYEGEIEFLNSVVVDMQRKCDNYKSRLSQLETINIMNKLDNLIGGPQAPASAIKSKGVTLADLPPPPPPPLPAAAPARGPKGQPLSGPAKGQSISFGGVSVCGSRSSTLRRNGELDNHNTGDRPLGGSVTATSTLVRPKLANNGGQSNGNTDTRYDTKPSRISGRPFCDICNVFDLHHTIYCPRVSEKLAAAHHLGPDMNADLDGAREADSQGDKLANGSTNGPCSNNINNNNNNNNSNNSNITHSSQNQNSNSNGSNSNNNNNNNNDNNYFKGNVTVDELFREYEQSLEEATTGIRYYASLRRQTTATNNATKTHTLSFGKPPMPRPHCDLCNLYGHTSSDCSSSSVRAW